MLVAPFLRRWKLHSRAGAGLPLSLCLCGLLVVISFT